MLESFIYQYTLEALIFGAGIYCGIRTGVLSPATPQGRHRLAWLCAGFLLIFSLQGATLIWGK